MNLTAKTQMTIHASPNKVWDALTKPELVKQYMMGADVKSDWQVGSPLTYTGVYQDKPFEEKGVIQKIERDKLLQATHFSTSSGKEDKPENYAVVTWELKAKDDGATAVTVSQDGISTEKGVAGSKANWKAVLQGLKQTVETPSQAPSAAREVSAATANNGQFVWHDHLSGDPKAAIAFYTEVVGWKTQPSEDGSDYVHWVGRQGPLGGVMKLDDQATKMGATPQWMGHVQVENVDTATALAKKLGGKVHTEPTDIPAVGRFAVIADPQGASLSIFKPNRAMALHDASQEGEFSWNELVTHDSAAAFKFYSAMFGWKILRETDMGKMGTYRVYGVGEKPLGGMMTLPKGVSMSPAWLYYAETSDLDAAIGRATKHGAKITTGPMDVPDGSRIAQLTDPAGAPFALRQVQKR